MNLIRSFWANEKGLEKIRLQEEYAGLMEEREEYVHAATVCQARLDAQVEASEFLLKEIEYQRGRIEELTAELLTMKREGFDPPPPMPEAATETIDALPIDVLAAIEEVAQPGQAFYMQQVRDAEEALEGGLGEKELVEQIKGGGSLNPHFDL